MVAVFVHGVADTHHLWDKVRGQMPQQETVALSLPGFGVPRPGGFTSTKEEYVDWIIARIEEIGRPVDLVGHDWGCILTARVASLRPDLLTSWAGGGGPISRRYVWHRYAKVWQTPGEGEAFWADFQPGPFADFLGTYRVPREDAMEIVSHIDETMKDSILRLYRSAVDVGAEWEPGLANASCRNMMIWGIHDPECPIHFADDMGGSMRAEVVKLDCGHWTPLELPTEQAAALLRHWRGDASA